MKIKINNITIARGDAFQESPMGLSIDGQKNIQITSYFRAEHIKAFDRGNAKTKIKFKLKRHHSSEEEASKFSLDHTTKLNQMNGDLLIINEGSEKKEYSLHSACITRIYSELKGMSTEHHYEIIGGKIS